MAPLADAASIRSTITDLIAREEDAFLARQPRSAAMAERARRSLAGGATSSWMIARPGTVWISHGQGSKVYDLDGTEYVDLHAGYGVMLVGHAHPAVVEAVQRRVRARHALRPTDRGRGHRGRGAGRRFGLPRWRFCNSGTEATMDAVHLMRAITGRDLIVKIEGSYHGHHDAVMVSMYSDVDELGPRERPRSVAAGRGIPQAMVDLALVVPFNDLDVLERVLDRARRAGRRHDHGTADDERRDRPAPARLPGGRAGAHPAPRRAAGLRRGEDRPHRRPRRRHRAPRRAARHRVPGQGHGRRHPLRCHRRHGRGDGGHRRRHATTRSGPSTATRSRWRRPAPRSPRSWSRRPTSASRCSVGACSTAPSSALHRIGVPVYGHRFGAKGCLVFAAQPVRDYREFLAVDGNFSHAHWLIQHNGGVFLPPWGKSEQWTLSAQHSLDDADRFVANVERMTSELALLDSWMPDPDPPRLFRGALSLGSPNVTLVSCSATQATGARRSRPGRSVRRGWGPCGVGGA